MANDKLGSKNSSTDSEPAWSNESPVSNDSLSSSDGKDRGYAWVVLAASFFCQVIGVGSALSAGAFTPMLVRTFEGSREAVAWVGSLHAGLIFMAGPLSGMLADRYGYRSVIIVGALLASCGVALSACVTHLWMLYVTYGIMAGTGISFTYIPSVTLLANYFERWKYIAFSVSSTGVGIGTLVLPQYIEWLLNEYGWRNAYILTAGVLLQLTICGALMIDPPVTRHALPPMKAATSPCITHDLFIIAEWRFSLFLLNNYLFNFGSLILFVFIADYAQVKGMTAQQGSYLISAIGISNGVGRVVNTLLSACNYNMAYVYVLSCSLSGVSVCLINLSVDSSLCFLTTATCCALYGFLFGVQLGNHAIVTNMLSGVGRLNYAFGITMFLNGVGAITGPPVAGLLYKVTERYEPVFYVAGASIILAGVILLPMLVATPNPSTTPPTPTSHLQSGIGDIVIASIPNFNWLRDTTALTHHSAMDMRHLSISNHLTHRSVSYHVIPDSRSLHAV